MNICELIYLWQGLKMKKWFLLLLTIALVGCEQGSSTIETSETSSDVGKTDVVPEPSGRILQWGIYTLLRGGEVIDSGQTSTGKAVSKPVMTRDRQTDRIPLIKDKYMA